MKVIKKFKTIIVGAMLVGLAASFTAPALASEQREESFGKMALQLLPDMAETLAPQFFCERVAPIVPGFENHFDQKLASSIVGPLATAAIRVMRGKKVTLGSILREGIATVPAVAASYLLTIKHSEDEGWLAWAGKGLWNNFVVGLISSKIRNIIAGEPQLQMPDVESGHDNNADCW